MHFYPIDDDELQEGIDLLRRNLQLGSGQHFLVLVDYPLVVEGDQQAREHVGHHLCWRRALLD